MNMIEIAHEMAETLRADETFAGVAVIEEDKGNVESQDAQGIARQEIAVVVGWDAFTPEKQSAETVVGEAELSVTVFERPLVNRAAAGAKTLKDLSVAAAKALTYAAAEGMASPLFLKGISGVAECDGGTNGVVMQTVSFRAKAEL